MSGEIIQIATQRVSECRLLVSEESDEWIESAGSGLVLYLSFVNGGTGEIDDSRIAKAVKSIMNAKLASSSGWKSDHSDAQSLASLVSDNVEGVHIIIVPQATLSGRLVPGDKYLKYHRQVGKERGFELYSKIIHAVAKSLGCTQELDTKTGGQSACSDRMKIVWGSYGKRQGWEMKSTGPSTHYFEF